MSGSTKLDFLTCCEVAQDMPDYQSSVRTIIGANTVFSDDGFLYAKKQTFDAVDDDSTFSSTITHSFYSYEVGEDFTAKRKAATVGTLSAGYDKTDAVGYDNFESGTGDGTCWIVGWGYNDWAWDTTTTAGSQNELGAVGPIVLDYDNYTDNFADVDTQITGTGETVVSNASWTVREGAPDTFVACAPTHTETGGEDLASNPAIDIRVTGDDSTAIFSIEVDESTTGSSTLAVISTVTWGDPTSGIEGSAASGSATNCSLTEARHRFGFPLDSTNEWYEIEYQIYTHDSSDNEVAGVITSIELTRPPGGPVAWSAWITLGLPAWVVDDTIIEYNRTVPKIKILRYKTYHSAQWVHVNAPIAP